MERNRRAGKRSDNQVRPRHSIACDARRLHPLHQFHTCRAHILRHRSGRRSPPLSPAWGRVIVAKDMGKRYHARRSPGSAPRGGGRDDEPGRLRLPAERGVAHQRFEAAQRLGLLGRTPCGESRAMAETFEGKRQGPQERTGEAFDELDGEPGRGRGRWS